MAHVRASFGMQALVLALWLLVLTGLIWIVMQELGAYRRSIPERIVGQVEHLHPQSRKGGDRSLALKLDSRPYWLRWDCTLCRAYDRVRDLRDAPWPRAEAYAVGNRLVGLKIDGRVYLDPKVELSRLVRGRYVILGVLASLVLVLCVYAARVVKVWRGRYKGPDPQAAQHTRDLVARSLRGEARK